VTANLSTPVFLISSAVKVVVVFTVLMVTVALLTWLERRVAAWVQDRSGPNRVGPWGILQPVADGLKNLLKEETLPAGAARPYFVAAPMLAIVPALVTFAVIPFAAPLPTRWGVIPMIVADVPVGVLFLLAFGSMAVYGIVLAGWASNSKYALLGGLRASAQLISYEVGFGMSLVPVFLLAGDVTVPEIVWTQQRMGLWFVFPLTLAFLTLLVCAFAETNRLPFDLPEAESELVTGYHTEYSSMKFSMFFIAEFAAIVTASGLLVSLFFGGWDIPFWSGDDMWITPEGTVIGATPAVWKTVLTGAAFAAKTGFFVFTYMWVRWTLPRFRYDQLMALGWKFILPVTLVYVTVLAVAMVVFRALGIAEGARPLFGIPALEVSPFGLAVAAVNAVMLVALVFGLDRGRFVTGATARARRLARQARIRAERERERRVAAAAAGR
jgi:NADH-quinone oxidoreductase subunit H